MSSLHFPFLAPAWTQQWQWEEDDARGGSACARN